MTHEVLLSIKGLQFDIGAASGALETIIPAKYYHYNDEHYVVYDEVMEGLQSPVKNMIRFRGDCLEVTKKGAVNLNMIFEENKKNIANYATPFGELIIGVDTDVVKMTKGDKRICLEVDYRLDVNYMHMADCQICVDVVSRESGLSLRH